MTRSVLTIAAALLATSTLFASGAQACISCNYVPEVINTPVSGQAFHGKRADKKRVYVAAKEHGAPSARKRIAKNQPAPKKQAGPKKVEVAEASPQTSNDPLTGSAEETKVADLGCKKFIATVGTTVSVPCE